jgi:small subunit ribosomal protein S21
MTTESDIGYSQNGICVTVKNNDITRALRKMKKLIQSEGIMQELRRREAYEKPSTTKRKDRTRAIKRWQKKCREIAEVL